MRTVVAGLVVIGLAIALFLVWPRGSDEERSETVSETSTTTTSEPVSTTSTAVTTTTGSHVVRTVEEAEEILRDLWFGWFEGIYNQDEDRIREVVANPDQIEAAVTQFGVMSFTAIPSPELLAFSDTEILQSDETCLAIWSVVDATQLVGASSSGVFTFLAESGSWYFISSWAFKEDLWQEDCQSQLRS
jgi:hypothetical protein